LLPAERLLLCVSSPDRAGKMLPLGVGGVELYWKTDSIIR
jgi:hypothetical protein